MAQLIILNDNINVKVYTLQKLEISQYINGQ